MWTRFSVVGERGSWQEPGKHDRAEMVLAVNPGEPALEETELVVSHGSGHCTHCRQGTSQYNMDTIRAKEISLMKSSRLRYGGQPGGKSCGREHLNKSHDAA